VDSTIWIQFLKYVIGSSAFTRHVLAVQTGTAVPHISGGQIKSFMFRLPDLREQRAIASVLGSLDDKIELNRRMNETLEALARVLFKSWFVDFDPVRAKMKGRQPTGMDAETAALFPDSLEGSPLGKIPKGWEIGTLGECTDLNPEAWSRNNAPSQITYVDLANTKWGYIEATQVYEWEDAPSRAQRILRPGDTIVGTVRPGNGSFSLVAEEGLTGSTGFAVLRPHKAIYEEFVYLTATSSENIERLSRLADGAAYPAVRPGVVSATQTVQSHEPLIECFSAIVRPLLSRIAAGQKETSILATIRDALLPRLLSGEVRVEEAEEQIEGVL
jgi:type I restriction enzyme S subunit